MSTISSTGMSSSQPIPLEQGDHLTREEFERRYDAMRDLKKAELIEGIVYLPGPVPWKCHAVPHAIVVGWIGFYKAHTSRVDACSNCHIRLDVDNEPQPDATLIILPSHGGQAQFSEDDYLENAPEFIAEIASSSASMDLNTKLRIYQCNGVREYLVWRVLEEKVDWFVLRGGQFQPLTPDADGILRSETFPGLWLDPTALLKNDLAKVLAVVQRGIASEEHTAFVKKLEIGEEELIQAPYAGTG